MFETLTDLEEKKTYVLQDAKLVMECVAHNNYELLNVINAISQLNGIKFQELCKSNNTSKIWDTVLEKLVREEIIALHDRRAGTDFEVAKYDRLRTYFEGEIKKETFVEAAPEEFSDELNSEAVTAMKSTKKKSSKDPKYSGGWVFNNIVSGEYRNVSVFDVTSLYPTMIINNNISFETVNCMCCEDKEEALVPAIVLEGDTWKHPMHICVNELGILPTQVMKYMTERIEYKKLAKQAELENPDKCKAYLNLSNSYKILINSAYGYMGYEYGKYKNIDAAKLVTACGRATIKECVRIATKHMKWDVIYGDTDSLFVNNSDTIPAADIEKFQKLCQKRCRVNMELDKTYERLLLHRAKNYLGVIKGSNKLVIKGLAGKKSDRCLWVRSVFKQMLEDYRNGINPYVNITSELGKLYHHKIENTEHKLIISKKLGMNPEAYKVNNIQKIIGIIKNLEAGDTARYYLSDSQNKFTEDVNDISIKKYEKQLIDTLKPVLKLLKYDLKKELDVALNIVKSKLADSTSDNYDEEIPIVSIEKKPRNQKLIARSASQEIVQLD